MLVDNVRAATDVDSREIVLCMRCPLEDCNDNSSNCLLSVNPYAAQYKYAKTAKGKVSNLRGQKAYYKRNKEKVKANQAIYRARKRLEAQHVKIDC